MKRKRKKQSLRMNLLSLDSLKDMDSDSRIGEILNMVKQNRMVILDGRLSPDEELILVQATMGEVGEEVETEQGFPGIEVCTLEREPTKYQEVYQKVLNMFTNKPPSNAGLTVIGPSNIVKQIKKMKTESAFEVLAEI